MTRAIKPFILSKLMSVNQENLKRRKVPLIMLPTSKPKKARFLSTKYTTIGGS